MSSLVYHLHPPTRVKQTGKPFGILPKVAVENNMRSLSFHGLEIPTEQDYLRSRKILFMNDDMRIGLMAPSETAGYFFKNADADEMLFVHKGSGTLKTMFGSIRFGYGDYLVIPRGTVYQLNFDDAENRLLLVESNGPILTPRRYRNDFGQLLEHSPFCERDFRRPENLETHAEPGDFEIMIQKRGRFSRTPTRSIRSMSRVGMAIIILTRSPSSTSSPSPAASICRLLFTRRLKAGIL